MDITHLVGELVKKVKVKSEEIHPVTVSQLKGKTVLIVDDTETALTIVENIVKKAGMVPILARSGKEALTHFGLGNLDFGSKEESEVNQSEIQNRKSEIEIAIIDIMMPGMSGHELAYKISELTGGMTNLTANAMKGDREKYLEGGMDDYVPKPFKREDLQNKPCEDEDMVLAIKKALRG